MRSSCPNSNALFRATGFRSNEGGDIYISVARSHDNRLQRTVKEADGELGHQLIHEVTDASQTARGRRVWASRAPPLRGPHRAALCGRQPFTSRRVLIGTRVMVPIGFDGADTTWKGGGAP